MFSHLLVNYASSWDQVGWSYSGSFYLLKTIIMVLVVPPYICHKQGEVKKSVYTHTVLTRGLISQNKLKHLCRGADVLKRVFVVCGDAENSSILQKPKGETVRKQARTPHTVWSLRPSCVFSTSNLLHYQWWASRQSSSSHGIFGTNSDQEEVSEVEK